MRLTHIALALTLVLLGVTGYLAWEGQQEARGARQQLEFIKNQQQAQLDAGAVPAQSMIRPPSPGQIAAAPISPPPPVALTTGPMAKSKAPVTAPVASKPATALTPTPAGSPANVPPTAPGLSVPTPAPLTPLQKQIISMPTIAKVKQFEKEAGFVIIGAGKSQRIAKGVQFDLRRENAIVGRITIGDTIEDDESVGDLDPATVPTGVIVQAGDEVIQVVNP